MKYTLLFSILIMNGLISAQTINHFENPDSRWFVAGTYPNGNDQNPNFVETSTIVYGFQGDTLIDNQEWFKLYSSMDSSFQDLLIYHGLIRTDANRVFYLDTLNQLDTLYDFSLTAGDSVLFNLYDMYPEWIQIIGEVSIEINGIPYSQLIFEEPELNAFDELNEIWIEGIGSIHGPLFPNKPVKFSQEIPDSMLVTCTFSENQQVWQNPSYPNCITNIILEIDQPDDDVFKVYPNPFSNLVYIEKGGVRNFRISVHDVLGNLIVESEVRNDLETLDFSELIDGIYFLNFWNSDYTKTVKMIKKH